MKLLTVNGPPSRLRSDG